MRSIILVLAALLVSAIPAKADCPAGRVSSCYRLGGKIVCGCCPAGTAYSCQPIFGGKSSAAATDVPRDSELPPGESQKMSPSVRGGGLKVSDDECGCPIGEASTAIV